MAKIFSLILLVAVVALCTANPARLTKLHKSRFSARQELAEDVPAQTPYPPSGIKPDIPFDLPNEEQPEEPLEVVEPEEPVESVETVETEEPAEPIETEEPTQPDNTYLPPDNLLPPAETYGLPDQFYGAPEASGDDEEQGVLEPVEELIPQEPEAENVNVPQPERLVLAKRLRKQNVRPAKLRAPKLQARAAKVIRSQRLVTKPVYANGALVAYKVLRV